MQGLKYFLRSQSSRGLDGAPVPDTRIGERRDPQKSEGAAGLHLARPENLYDRTRYAPLQQRVLADTHLQHIIPACRVRQAEGGESEVTFTCGPGFR